MGQSKFLNPAPSDNLQALGQLVDLIKGVNPEVGSDTWHCMVRAESSLGLLAEWHDLHAWKDAQLETPMCYGDAIFIGVNENGYVGAFNLLDEGGNCVYCTAEGSVVVMSGLRWWRRHERNTRPPFLQTPDAAAQPEPVDIEGEARALVAIAAEMGLVLTVEHVPQPGTPAPATVVRVRPASPAERGEVPQ